MATSNPYGSGRFKINVNRVKSKKWKDADKVDYGGGWGDDDSDDGYDDPAPVSADNPRHPAWNAPANAYPSNRSVTNPSPPRGGQRPSFDRGDERRHFSSAGNFDSPYPTTQRSPFPEPQHDDVPAAASYGTQAPLRLNTQGPGPMPQGFRPGSRGRQYPPYEDVPMSAPGSFPQQRRSGSSNRPPHGDIYAHHESPMRPESRSSNASHRQFPPRKQSLSQQTPPPDFTQRSHSPARSHASGTATATSANDDRPPPVLIRPSDIYKRHAEEMEKARKSQDSSRPSTASEPNRAREGSVGARSTTSDPKESTGSAQPNAEDSDSTRRLKPTLDPVPERKSEYGFENLGKSTSRDNAQPEDPKIEERTLGVSRHGTDASSVYTDRPDPISASTLSRNVSLADDIPERQSLSNDRPSFGLPPIGRVSGFGVDIGVTDNTAPDPTPDVSQPPRDAPPPVPSKDIVTSENDEPDIKALQHQPTMGYTSVVQQAFDQSQRQEPLSHSSTSSTVDRSNSVSTTDISPIISRKPDTVPTSTTIQNAHPVISEEFSQRESRPTSTTTLKPTEVPLQHDDDLPSPPILRTGYRRDVTPPSRDNSPAKKPLEVGPRHVVQPYQGSLVDERTGAQEQARGRAQSIKDKPLPPEPTAETSTPHVSTPLAIMRSESPPKGTVRDLAGRLESSSGRSSPTNSGVHIPLPGLSQARPPPQARFDSFRPAIPGGWQSYTTSAASGTPGADTPVQRGVSPPRAPYAQTRTESSESVPTAHAPTNVASQEHGVTQRAFAAAASAGSALAGALTGHRLSERDQSPAAQSSDEESENEWDRSSSSSDGFAGPPAPRALPEEQRTGPGIEGRAANPPAAGIRPSSGTPDQPQSVAASTPLSIATSSEADVPQSTLDYFPAPLRTSRSIDPSSLRPPVPNASIAQETPPESENERLQLEIVKSLTPKSSNLDDQAPAQGHQPRADPELSAYRAVTDVGAGPQSSPAPQSFPSHPTEGPQIIPLPQSITAPSTEDVFPGPPPLQSISRQPAEAGLPSDDVIVVNAGRAPNQGMSMPPQPSTAPQQHPAIGARPDSALPGTRQPQPPIERESPAPGQPLLQKRFSWETGSSPPESASTPKATSPPSTGSPDTIRASFQSVTGASEVAPPREELNQPSTRQASPPIQQSVQSMQASTDVAPQQPSQPFLNLQTVPSQQSNQHTQHPVISPTTTHQSQPSPTLSEPPTFRTILNLGSPVERIKAFDESRQFYATPNEQLQGWLMSMKTAENSDLFATNGRLSLDASESPISHKPMPRRILTESAGARHMQEDGKKLMAAAGRFGGKAGHAAKGLFAKGKEKMRSASTSEKGMLAGRRKSTGPLPDESEDVSSPSQSRNSTYLEGPPQIPLNITPASPLTSPTDWFSNRELMGSQTSGLSSILQQGAAASSPTPAHEVVPQSTSEHDRHAPRGGVAPTEAVAAVSVPALSPAISALDSEQEQNEDTGVPSRSISQLTRPTDHSPVESPHRANVERRLSRKESSAARPRVTAAGSDLAASTLAPPPPFADRHDGPTSDAESSDRSLRVPQARRRSVISDVSSASPSPGLDTEGQHLRSSISLSPADEVPVETVAGPWKENRRQAEEPVPSISPVQAAGQPGEQAADRQAQSPSPIAPPSLTAAEPLRAGETIPVDEGIQQRPPQEQPTQQRTAPNQQYDAEEHRPFSFAGIEGVGAIHQSEPLPDEDLSRIPSQPMSPVSQARSSAALSKAMSQVSVEEVPDQTNVPDHRHSRSYSRPFGVDPNVRNHPALRPGNPEQAQMDRAQMYSSESPLPSARRAQEEIDRRLQQSEQRQPTVPPPQRQPYEEGYRIPGPYVQEYRSPKQISSPKNGRSQIQVQASGKPLPSTLRTQSYAGQPSPPPQPGPGSYIAAEPQNVPSYQDHASYMNNPATYAEYDMKPGEWHEFTQGPPVQQHRQSMGLPPPPVQQQVSRQQTPAQAAPVPPPAPQPQAERKKSTFGKLFGGSSSKGSKLQKPARAESPVDRPGNLHKEKRGSMLRRNESASSRQSSKYGSQDQLGQLPPPNVHSHFARRQSSHVLGEPTPDSGDKPPEVKKKRFSGLGGKLFKSSSTARAATAPTPPTQTTGSEHQRTGQRLASPGPYSAQTPRVMSPEPYSAQTPYSQYPVGPGSYFNQSQAQSPYPQSAYPQGQFPPQYPAAASPYQQQPRPGDYAHPPQSPPPPGPQQQSAGRYATGVFMNPNQTRPSDLRIDTSSQNSGHYNVPATAPAQVHPPRATSFASTPYNPNPSPGITTATGPGSPPPHSAQSPPRNPLAHVIDLHKRSRSPRLGRAASDDLDASQHQQPNNLLGTFTSKNISPVGGVPRPENDQERPFAITVPGLDDDDNARRKHHLRERIAAGASRSDTPVSVESGGHAAPPHSAVATNTGGLERNVSVLEGYSVPISPRQARRESARDKTTPGVIAELPGSKAEGYESEEEIPMSATAYPGQEWMPVFVGDGRWDD